MWKVTVATVPDDAKIKSKPVGSVTITIEPDDPVEPNDPVYTVGYPRSATVVVEDNNSAPIITCSVAVSHSERSADLEDDPEDTKVPDCPSDAADRGAAGSEDLPLWAATVHWGLPDTGAEQVDVWHVQYGRASSCDDEQANWIDTGYTVSPIPVASSGSLMMTRSISG